MREKELGEPSDREAPSDELHTAGPWVVFIDRESKTLSVMPAGRGGIIADVAYADDDKSDAECEANADLIAAAPKLLDLIKHMLGAIDGNNIDSEQIDGDYETGIPPHKWHEEWAHYARAALAKQSDCGETRPEGTPTSITKGK